MFLVIWWSTNDTFWILWILSSFLVHPCDKKDNFGCEHKCNKDGSHGYCSCEEGFKLREKDEKKCDKSRHRSIVIQYWTNYRKLIHQSKISIKYDVFEIDTNTGITILGRQNFLADWIYSSKSDFRHLCSPKCDQFFLLNLTILIFVQVVYTDFSLEKVIHMIYIFYNQYK